MVKVECDGCKSPYQVEERRIPPAGLRMRCSKCGTSMLVTKDGAKTAQGPASVRAAASVLGEDADLPAVASPRADPRGKPAVKGKGEGLKVEAAGPAGAAPPGLLDADLPSPVREKPPAPERPTSKGRAVMQSFGDIDAVTDLPAPGRSHAQWGNDLPAVAKAGSAPRQAPTPPARRPSWPGDEDLPVPSDRGSLQTSAPRAREFGELDLPITRDADRPRPAAKTSPIPGRRPSFSDLDLSLPGGDATASGRPSVPPASGRTSAPPPSRRPSVPPPSKRTSVPPPSKRTSAPPASVRSGPPSSPGRLSAPPSVGRGGPSSSSGRPSAPPSVRGQGRSGASQPKDVSPNAPALAIHEESMRRLSQPELTPLPLADPGWPLSPGEGLPEPGHPGAEGPAPPDATAGAFDFDLPDAPAGSPAPKEAAAKNAGKSAGKDAPKATGLSPGIFSLDAASLPGSRGAVDAGAGALDTESLAAAPSSRAIETTGAPAPQATPKRASIARPALLAGLLVLGGASLALIPDVGPFGIHFLRDQIGASSNAAALAQLRRDVGADLDTDTSTSAAAALARARAAQEAAPRFRPTAAYAAYVALAASLRFGRRGGDEAYGKQLLARMQSAPSDPLDLAIAAQHAVDGQLAEARKVATSLAQRAPGDIDAAVLVGEIELAARATEPAVAAWKRAVAIRKSPRTYFGLARALAVAGDLADAEANARGAIEGSPRHVGAHTLLASMIWRGGAREDDAIALLTKVTSADAAKGGASGGDLVEAQTLLGLIHLERSRISAAEEAFAAALAIDPHATRALVGSGELYYRSGRYSEALSRFEAAMRADPGDVAVKVGAAKTWLALERKREAKDLLKKLWAQYPGDPLVAYWLGRAEEALGNKKDAEAAYEAGIKAGGTRPEVVDAYVELAYLLSSVGRAEDAAAKLAEASAKFPGLPALHKAKGEIALQTGRYEQAKREFEAALARSGDDLGARFKLGVALRRMRSFDEAAAAFDKVAEVDKEYPGLALERGLLYEQTGKGDKALEMYAAALKKAPSDVDLKLRVGGAQVMAGQVKQAEPILREVLKVRPSSAEANHFLGRALLVKGTSYPEAMRFLERAAEIDPNRAEYQLYVGWAANEAGQPARAESALRRALELDQELGDAYWQRGVLLQKQGATLDALAELKKALEKRPSRLEAYATMALCYQDQSRWPEAQEAWKKAIAGNDSVPEWHYRLGRIYAAANNRLGAIAELEKAVALVEASDLSARPAPTWLFDAHFLLGEAMRATGQKEKAIHYYTRYLATAPADNAYRPDAERALASLGVPKTN